MPEQDWIPDTVWLEILALSAMDSLRDLPDSVVRNDAAWHAWYDNEAPERAVIPDFQTRVTKFARMCVVKVGPPSCLHGGHNEPQHSHLSLQRKHQSSVRGSLYPRSSKVSVGW